MLRDDLDGRWTISLDAGGALRRYAALEAAMLIGRDFVFAIASAFTNIITSPDADRISRFETQKLVSFIFTLCACLVPATFAYADTLVVLLEGLGGRISSPGIVSFQKELSVIPNTRVALPLAQHNWRNAVNLIQQQKPETKIIVIGYSLGANNSTYLAKNVKHVDKLIAIQASVWGRATAVGENVDKAIEIYNPKFWRTAGLGAKRLVGIHFSYVTNNDSHFYADNDPEVHKFVFNEVKKLADPTAPAQIGIWNST
jgi:hypothetical protein